MDLYPPTSKDAPTQVPHTVIAKDRNSSKRTGLKCMGASHPGKLGIKMIAVIWKLQDDKCQHMTRQHVYDVLLVKLYLFVQAKTGQ